MINDKYYNRRYVISGIAVVIVLTYIIRLFYLQIIDQSTKDQADNNALVKQTIYPSRGLIYDRNGELLVFNQPIYEITMTMRDMGKEWDTLAFCRCLQITQAEFDALSEALPECSIHWNVPVGDMYFDSERWRKSTAGGRTPSSTARSAPASWRPCSWSLRSWTAKKPERTHKGSICYMRKEKKP